MKALCALLLIALLSGCTSLYNWRCDTPDYVAIEVPGDMWSTYSWMTCERTYDLPTAEGVPPQVVLLPERHVGRVFAHHNTARLHEDLGYAADAGKAKSIIRKRLGAMW